MKAHLHILQLEGYDPIRFLRWWVKNPLKFKLENKKPLVWTNKAKFIYYLSGGFWPLMFLALLLLKPYEMGNKYLTKARVRTKVRELKKGGLKVIGITGSFGKTSTKEFLYQILKQKYRVLRTPESYNTVFGVAKVVEWELDGNYDFFICEMGAYKRGEIAELCRMVEPDYGILTGINEQHLERFGSLENIVKAKYELVDYVSDKRGRMVIYGQGEYSHPREQNIEGAMQMAKILGVPKPPKELKNPIHRLSLLRRGDMTIIDDAYSSNTDGFAAAVKYLKSFDGWKVIVTPGILELGSQSYQIHKKLGALLTNINQVILVGKNERTKGLADGLGSEVIYIDKVTEAINKVTKSKSVILFENDLPDNY